MGPLMYFCDGIMGYEYSFLVDFDISSPSVQHVFSFRRAQDKYGSLGFLAADFPGKMDIKHSEKKNEVLLGHYRDSWVAANHLYHTAGSWIHSCNLFTLIFGPL